MWPKVSRWEKSWKYTVFAGKQAWPTGRWSEVALASTAAACAAILVVVGLLQGSWLEDAKAALAAGIGTILLNSLAMFVRGLVMAPRAVRRENVGAVTPAGNPHVAAMSIKLRPSDTMQQEASAIAKMAEDVATVRDRGIVDDGREFHYRIQWFGDRAANDPWITKKSRLRSLELHRRITEMEDPREIAAACTSFIKLKPSL